MRYDDEKDLKYIHKGTYFDADMSEEDKALVQTLQDAWSTYSAKGDQQGMDTAHRQAESIRAKYGYSGGADGSDYIKVPQTQTGEQFSYASAPQYVNRWQTLIDQAANSILNREAFSYDHTKDPLYQQLEQNYTQKGQQAMDDTLGIVSQRTGGIASSYATQAGQQAYNGYMSELADKIPELRQLAYAMYMDEGNRMRANLEMLRGMENQNYNQYLNRLNQFNTDRSFLYGVNRDAVSDRRYDNEWQYQKDRDTVADQRYADEWQYQMGRDVIADQRYADELSYNRAWDENEREYNRGQDALSQDRYDSELLAQYGDFSRFKSLGYTDTQIAAMQKAYQDQLAAADSSASGGYDLTYSNWWNQGVRSEGEAYDQALQNGYSNAEAENMSEFFKNWMMNQNDLLENTTGVSNYQALSDSLKSMQGIVPLESAQSMLDKAYLDGQISEEQYNTLQDYIDGHRWL